MPIEDHPESDLRDRSRLRRGGPWLLIGLVAVATVVGVLLVPDELDDVGGDAPEPAPRAPATQQAPSLLADRPAEAEPAPKAATGDADRGDGPAGSSARELIAQARANGDVDAREIAAAAAAALQDGAADDAYLLYFYAARSGDAAAAMVLGTEADPAHRDPDTGLFDAPDLVQAHKWYKLAAENGDPQARARLVELRERVERSAARGDPEAQRMTLLWQRP